MLQEYYGLLKFKIVENDWYSFLFLLFGGLLFYLITLKIILPLLYFLIRRSPTDWDDVLIDRKVLSKLVLLPSLFFVNQYSYLLTNRQDIVSNIINALFVLVFLLALDRFLIAVNDVYERLPSAKGRPIKGYIQIMEIIVFLFGGITVIAILIGRSPWVMLSGLGAMTAILMLIFKDTILSFVAGVRITTNKLIEIGDWIEMPQYGADGDVIDIALHSIQVQNWDKTITIIPTHKLIDDAFKNWKGMQKSGGRRIMRNINIDLASIRFCDEEMLARFEKIRLLNEYLTRKKEEISAYNLKLGIDEHDYINGRHLTNIGTFRAYIENYLRKHPGINQNLIMMTRQLESGSTGVPLQVYAFTNNTAWTVYEGIQADIFDHLLAISPEFGLRLFQYPSGKDLVNLRQ
jgi:miniconductance mechanosensitive channel